MSPVTCLAESFVLVSAAEARRGAELKVEAAHRMQRQHLTTGNRSLSQL